MRIRVFDHLPGHTITELRKITDVVEDGWDFDLNYTSALNRFVKKNRVVFDELGMH